MGVELVQSLMGKGLAAQRLLCTAGTLSEIYAAPLRSVMTLIPLLNSSLQPVLPNYVGRDFAISPRMITMP